VSDLVKGENLEREPPAGRVGVPAGVIVAPTRDIGADRARLEHSDGTPTGDEPGSPGTDTRSGNSGCSHTAREVSAHRAPPAYEPAFSVIRWAPCSKRSPASSP